MKYLILLLFLPTAFAVEREFDLNKDGKTDRIEVLEDKKLVLLKEDLNRDGKFERLTEFKTGEVFRVVKLDQNSDGVFDIEKTYRHLGKEVVLQTRIFSGGKTKHLYYKTLHHTHAHIDGNAECMMRTLRSHIDELHEQVLPVAASANGGFIPTTFGFQVDYSCLEKWSPYFLTMLRDSMSEGLECLESLATERLPAISPALVNAFEISQMAQERMSTIVCGEMNYNWSQTAAHASTVENQEMDDYPGITHPYMSINPTDPISVPPRPGMPMALDFQVDTRFAKRTFFHERFHNLGHLHGQGHEYAYTCASCCSSIYADPESKSLACKLCANSYPENNRTQYLRDIKRYASLTESNALARVTRDVAEELFNQNKENPDVLVDTLEVMASMENRDAYYYAQYLLSNHELSSAQQERLNGIPQLSTNYTRSRGLLTIATMMGDLATDGEKVLNFLESNHEVLFAEIAGRDDEEAKEIRGQMRSFINHYFLEWGDEVTQDQKDRGYALYLAFAAADSQF